MMSAEWNDHPFSFRKVTLSPRRLRAKYTLRTNLRFVLWVFRPCRGLVITLILSFSALSQRKPQQRFSPLSVCLRRRTSGNRFIGCKKSMPVTGGRSIWQDTHLYRCRSCQMSREEYPISQATQGRKISMPPTAPPTMNFGRTLQGKANRNLSEVAQRANVLKQGN